MLDTKHVKEQRIDITLIMLGSVHKRHDKTTLQQSQKGLAFCFDATLGIKPHRWFPARTPTVHRCPRGKAMGGPQHDPQYDFKIQQRTERRRAGQEVDGQICGQSQVTATENTRKHARPEDLIQERGVSSSTKSRMKSYRSWKTNSSQFRTCVTRHQHSGDETALQQCPRVEKPVDTR